VLTHKKLYVGLFLTVSTLLAQSPSAPTVQPPSYFANSGVRYNYYDKALTETTNFGFRFTSNSTASVGSTPANSFWVKVSVDATPRSQASSAGLRVSAAYFLKTINHVSFFFDAGPGIQTSSSNTVNTTTPTSLTPNTVANLLGSIGGGGGFIWNVCKTFKSSFNCNLVGDYDILAVTSQSVKPVIGIYFGTSF
jgi:hypothetical protein